MGRILLEVEKFLVAHEIWIKLITLLVAIIIGIFQVKINIRMKNLQDFVAIAAVPGPEGKIKLINTGRINLYLYGFDMPGNRQRLKKPRLLSVGTNDSAWYWIDPPSEKELKEGEEFLITLYIEDQFNQKWISEHGGEKIKVVKGEKGETVPALKIWSYRTYKKKWLF